MGRRQGLEFIIVLILAALLVDPGQPPHPDRPEPDICPAQLLRRTHPRLVFWARGGNRRLVQNGNELTVEHVGQHGSGLWVADPAEPACRLALASSPRFSYDHVTATPSGWRFQIDHCDRPHQWATLQVDVAQNSILSVRRLSGRRQWPDLPDWDSGDGPGFYQYYSGSEFTDFPCLQIAARVQDRLTLLQPKLSEVGDWTALHDDAEYESLLSAVSAIRSWSRSYHAM